LLEAQELQDGQVDSRVESETALVWTKSRVELHTVSAVDLKLVLVIFPYNAELDDALRNRNDFEGGLEFRSLLKESAVFEG
jgi:hypothetical protein